MRVEPTNGPLNSLHPRLVRLMRERNALLRAEVSLGNQIKAMLRVGASHSMSVAQVCDAAPRAAAARNGRRKGHAVNVAHGRLADPLDHFAVVVLKGVLSPIHKAKLGLERDVRPLVRSLPIWPWARAQRGCGEINLAQIEAAAVSTFYRCLADYPTPAALWTRFGVGLKDGKIQKRVSGRRDGKRSQSEKTAEAIRFGFSPTRRAILHNLGACLLRGNKGDYKKLYDERKMLETEKLVGEKTVKIHAHKRALRYIEKRFLTDLWRAWRDHCCCDTHSNVVEP